MQIKQKEKSFTHTNIHIYYILVKQYTQFIYKLYIRIYMYI